MSAVERQKSQRRADECGWRARGDGKGGMEEKLFFFLPQYFLFFPLAYIETETLAFFLRVAKKASDRICKYASVTRLMLVWCSFRVGGEGGREYVETVNKLINQWHTYTTLYAKSLMHSHWTLMMWRWSEKKKCFSVLEQMATGSATPTADIQIAAIIQTIRWLDSGRFRKGFTTAWHLKCILYMNGGSKGVKICNRSTIECYKSRREETVGGWGGGWGTKILMPKSTVHCENLVHQDKKVRIVFPLICGNFSKKSSFF